ncbi:hypothetical protein BMS3Abin04_01819 [bacterium BMS3Abin04]|nr:hypothetical protein BMS3Abin04_01819 [bacterium BMS3Abin04]
MEKTNYGFWKSVDFEFEEAIEKTKEALKEEGFGVLAELDFKGILKKKLDVDFKPYQVLAACNPPNAYKALQAEEQLGLLLPCNVIVYVNDNNETIVAAIDPVANMTAVNNDTVMEVAETIQSKLKKVISSL